MVFNKLIKTNVNILIVILIYNFQILNGQNLVTYYNQIPTSLNSNEITKANNILAAINYENYSWISLDPINSYLVGNNLSLNLPYLDSINIFKFSHSTFNDQNNYLWNGELMTNYGISPEHISIGCINGLISGEFVYNKSFYRIIPISQRIQLLIKFTNTNIIEIEGNMESNSSVDNTCNMTLGSCTINVLIVYPPNDAIPGNDFYFIGNQLINQVNNAFYRSKIAHRLKFVAALQINDQWVDESADLDRTKLENLSTTNTSQLYNSIQYYHADLVMLLSSGPNWGSNLNGLARLNANNQMFCGLAKIQASLDGNYTFTHEIGHLFGADHEDGTIPARAKLLNTIYGVYRTVMHQTSSQGSTPIINRILNYSNPSVKYFNEPTGTIDLKCNASVIQNYGCTVSEINNTPECKLNSYLSYDNQCSPTYIDIQITNTTPNICSPIYYTYMYSYDGFNFTTLCNLTTNTHCMLTNIPPNSNITIKIIAFDINNIPLITIYNYFRGLCENPNLPQLSQKIDFQLFFKNIDEKLMNLKDENIKEICFYSLDGKQVYKVASQSNIKNKAIDILDNLNKGLYILQIKQLEGSPINMKIVN